MSWNSSTRIQRKAVLVFAPQIGALAQQAQREADLRAEVDAAGFQQQRGVPLVGIRLLDLGLGAVALLGIVACRGRQFPRELEVALRRYVLAACAVEHRVQRPQMRIGIAEREVALEPQIEQPLAQEHQDLGLALDAQLRRESELDRVLTHHAIAERVEGRDGRTHEAVGHQPVDARLHLGGGLVGEGERQDLFGARALGRDQPCDPSRDHLGLAGSGAGDDQQRTGGMLDGFALFVVEIGEDCLLALLAEQRHDRSRGGLGSNGA